MTFKKAERKQAKLKIAITGVSGSGKTYSSLLIARGIVGEKGKIAVIDTENSSASLYSDVTGFDVLELEAPYEVEKYINGINEAIKNGYDIVVIDSGSHAWQQLLEEKARIDQRGGNSFTNWGKISPKHKAFLDTLLLSKIHIICTLRSKTEYSIEKDDNGKTQIKKLGLAPIQREGVDYEFTTVLDMSSNHEAEASKDRTGLFLQPSKSVIFKPTIETGEQIREWLEKGAKIKEEIIEKPKGDYSKACEAINKTDSIVGLEKIESMITEREWTEAEIISLQNIIDVQFNKIKGES